MYRSEYSVLKTSYRDALGYINNFENKVWFKNLIKIRKEPKNSFRQTYIWVQNMTLIGRQVKTSRVRVSFAYFSNVEMRLVIEHQI